MSANKHHLNQAKNLHQSGFTAFQNEEYKAAIDYFKRAQALGLDFVDEAEANRFIGSAYLQLNQGWQARRYLRKATSIGMFSGGSILLLAQAEDKRHWLYKWGKGESHSDKVEELLDWFLLSDIPNENSLNIVALKAFSNKKWHKALVLFEMLKVLNKSNLDYWKFWFLSCYKSGEIYRAWAEIENASSKIHDVDDDSLVKTIADICMIFGDFERARQYYVDISKSDKTNNTIILQVLEVYTRASEVSREFNKKAMFFLIKDYYVRSYIESIDNLEHFDLMLNSVSTYFKHFQTKQVEQNQDLQENTRVQLDSAYKAHEQIRKPKTYQGPKPNELLTPFERINKRQLAEMESVKELQKLNPIMNTLANFSFADELNNQLWKTQFLLNLKVRLYKILLAVFSAIWYLIPSVVFIDGLYGAVSGNNLLTLIFPSILSNSTPAVLQAIIAIIWFVSLIFADSVLKEKVNNWLVESMRSTLLGHTAQIGYMLVVGEAAHEYLLASQPIPHMGMNAGNLLEIGLTEEKPKEIRSGALVMAASKSETNDILPYKERLKTELISENPSLKFISAILLAIGKNPESLAVIEEELKKEKNEINDETVFYLALQSLAKYGDPLSAAILRNFVIDNLEDRMELFRGVQAINLLPVELRITTVIEILESIIGKNSEFRMFLDVLNGLGDPVVAPLVAFYNKHHKNLYGTDDLEVLLGVLNSKSEIGDNLIINWLVGTEPTQNKDLYDLIDMRYDFFISNKKFGLISKIAFDSKVNSNTRRKAAYYIAFFEKEKLQDVVFDLWQNDELSEMYIKTLGDIGTPACADKLSNLLEKHRETLDDAVGKKEYIYIYSALALCGDVGKNKLRSLVSSNSSLKVERLFALAALYGIDQNDLISLLKLKRALYDNDIDKYHRSHIFWLMDWCVRREDDIEFKMRLHRKPAPTKYYQFLKWVSRNSKLPEHVRVMAESEIANLKLREYDRALYLPKSYSKFEVLLEKIKHRLSEMKQ